MSTEEKIPGKSQTGNRKNIVKILAVLIGIIIAGWFWFVFLNGSITVDDASIDRDKVSISPKTLGKIAKIFADEGDPVTNGQVLVKLDTAGLEAQEKQAEASYAFSLENINLAQINLDRAQEDFNRADEQAKDQIITPEQYSHSKKTLEAAKAGYNIALRQSDVARAQLEMVRTSLKDATIASPFQGVVAKRWLMEGDVAQPGQAVLTVNNTESLWVTANIEEVNLSYFRVGKEVKIHVDAYPNIDFTGKIQEIGTDTASRFSLIPANNASGNFTKVTQRIGVKISIEPVNPAKASDVNLLPGMSVEVIVKKRG